MKGFAQVCVSPTPCSGGIGLNLPQDAVYPSLSSDSEGRTLDGNHRYLLHFDKGQWPPVDAFWSVTAYDAEGYFIPNAIKRQAIGDRDKLVANADGSLDVSSKAIRRARTRKATGCPSPKRRSRCCCAFTHRARISSMANGRRRRSCANRQRSVWG